MGLHCSLSRLFPCANEKDALWSEDLKCALGVMSTVAINIGRVVFDFSADSSRYSVVLVGVYFGPILDLPIKFEEPLLHTAGLRAVLLVLHCFPMGPVSSSSFSTLFLVPSYCDISYV